MTFKKAPLTFTARLLVFAMLLLLYRIHPVIGWIAMSALTTFVVVRFFRKAHRAGMTSVDGYPADAAQEFPFMTESLQK